MIIVGIDPGTAIVGYGIIECINNNYKLLDYGCIYTDKNKEMSKRLDEIYNGIELIFKTYKPDYVAVEELFFFKNNKTVISVGQARGVILLCAEKNGIKLGEYTPLQVKMGITGYGKSTKSQVQEMVRIVLKLKEIPKPDDAADALAIAVTHSNSIKNFNIIKDEKNISLNEIKEKEKSKKTVNIKSNVISAEEYRTFFMKKR